MVEKKKALETKLWVTRTVGRGENQVEEVAEENQIEITKFVTEPAVVKAEVGLTLNLGNYESARITCGCDIPCYKEEMAEAFTQAIELVTAQLKKQAIDVKNKINQRGKV